MPDPRTTPVEIGPDATGSRLRVLWKDGEETLHHPRDLRLACPCAGCVDEMTGVRRLRPEFVHENVHPRAIHYVGRYAIRFVWSDGHDTGIYPFDYLRRLSEKA